MKIPEFVTSISRHQALISILSSRFQLWPSGCEESGRGSRVCRPEAKVAVGEMFRNEKLFVKVLHSAEKNFRSAVSRTEVLSRTTEVTTQLSRRAVWFNENLFWGFQKINRFVKYRRANLHVNPTLRAQSGGHLQAPRDALEFHIHSDGKRPASADIRPRRWRRWNSTAECASSRFNLL